MIGAIVSILANELVIIRAVAAGVTSIALISSTPITFMVNRIVIASISMSSASIRATLTPETLATSGSNVANSRWR